MFYPQPSSGFFVKAGAGFAFSDTDFRMGSTTVTVDLGTGLGVIAGAGYDVRVARNFSVTPAVSLWYGHHRSVASAFFEDDTTLGTWNHNVVDVTLSVTFH